MKDGRLRELLVKAPLPDDLDARRRSWAVVKSAFAAREPVRRRPDFRPALALAVLAALVAAALSAPGEAVIERVRKAIGIERAQPALFSLPAPGRVLVTSTRGVWIVQPDGSKRLLGRYREASWSPSGLFVVASRHNELAAVEPDGGLRWTLARRAVTRPRWAGLRGDTRVAYLSRGRLRVVAGDGTGDRVAGRADPVPPAWRRGIRHVLAYVEDDGDVAVYDTDSRGVQFRVARRTQSGFGPVRSLDWSRGGRLLIAHTKGLLVMGSEGQRIARWRLPGVVSATFSPDGRRIAVLRRSDVLVVDARRPKTALPRRVFAGAGVLSGAAWSPDARWLLVGWQTADQWVFVRVVGPRRIAAVSNVSAQFRSSRFPRVEGWCCAP